MEYNFDDDYMDNDFDENYEEVDTCEEEILDEPETTIDIEEKPKEGIPFEKILFWGGYLAINIDEERKGRRQKKEKKYISDPEDSF